MSLTPEQKKAVASWVTAGDNLSAIQKKLSEQFQVSMTYRDVRFLVDDLNLALKDPDPKVDTSDVSKTPAAAQTSPAPAAPAAKKGLLDKAKEKLGLGKEEDLPPADDDESVPAAMEEDLDELPPAGGNV